MDVDKGAADRSAFLQVVASYLPLYVVGVLDEAKREGELVSFCPAHTINRVPSGDPQPELTFYVNLRESRYLCVRCKEAGSSANDFREMLVNVGLREREPLPPAIEAMFRRAQGETGDA